MNSKHFTRQDHPVGHLSRPARITWNHTGDVQTVETVETGRKTHFNCIKRNHIGKLTEFFCVKTIPQWPGQVKIQQWFKCHVFWISFKCQALKIQIQFKLVWIRKMTLEEKEGRKVTRQVCYLVYRAEASLACFLLATKTKV